LRALDVRAVISAVPPPWPGVVRVATFGGDSGVYAVPRPQGVQAAARIRIAYSVQAAHTPAQALQFVTAPTFDPDRVTVLESATSLNGIAEAFVPPAALPGRRPYLLTESPTRITIAAYMDAPGYLVLSDAYYPGWQASVDGQPAPVIPANLAFRAVLVPRGQHTVEFRYEPASFRVGATITLATTLALGAAYWLARRTRAIGPTDSIRLPLRAIATGNRCGKSPRDIATDCPSNVPQSGDGQSNRPSGLPTV